MYLGESWPSWGRLETESTRRPERVVLPLQEHLILSEPPLIAMMFLASAVLASASAAHPTLPMMWSAKVRPAAP